ncbi:hypothetical protein G7B40_001650 [Aetokthonos hydrillicola Thurmond2011]|uniref:Uncharacterized protein n=2 Tax=Aetokthonos TaxID=1550243 RepID=A0AAP5I1Y0_9CYAN|nr:hypothetical protein [Aetokthonos hydrillicola Thurmond2011]
MAKSGYQRLKEWRDRQSSGEELQKCKMCERPMKGKLSIERGFCSYCFPKTPEGQLYRKEIMERHYSKQQKQE